MKWFSKKIKLLVLPSQEGFTLPEVMASLMILALICSSVIIVLNNCIVSAANLALRMQAFEIARENMENLLTLNTVEETVEYGISEKYPEIQWQTTIETFSEPATSKIWLQAVCFAEYTDTEGQIQTVELTHWLTSLTDEQAAKIETQKEKNLLETDIIQTAEDAAEYADVDVETIEEWVTNGMRLTKDGFYIKPELELYKETKGKPTLEDRIRQAETLKELKGDKKDKEEKSDSEKKLEDQEDVDEYITEDADSDSPIETE